MDWREQLREIAEAVEDAKEDVPHMTDAQLVRGGAVVLQELLDSSHEWQLNQHVWRVWWAEAAKRNLLSDIMDAKNDRFN